jgi:hypothetical protein
MATVLIHQKIGRRVTFFCFCTFGRDEDDKPLRPLHKVSQDKAKSLGISFIPLEVSFRDTIESLKEKGFLTA